MDNININPVKNKKAYLQIIETLISLIANGKIKYGDKLYNESELMKMFNVSRPTLREALRVMEFLGIVTVSPRKGIIVNKPEDTSSYFPLIYIMLYQKANTKNLFELLSAIQIEMAGLAAERGTIEDFLILKKIVEASKERLTSNYKSFVNINYNFHIQISECAKNNVCKKLMKTLHMLMKIHLEQIIKRMPIEKRKLTIIYYSDICEAIINRNAKEAQKKMKEYLEIPYKYLINGSITNIF